MLGFLSPSTSYDCPPTEQCNGNKYYQMVSNLVIVTCNFQVLHCYIRGGGGGGGGGGGEGGGGAKGTRPFDIITIICWYFYVLLRLEVVIVMCLYQQLIISSIQTSPNIPHVTLMEHDVTCYCFSI